MKDRQIYQDMPEDYLHCYNKSCQLAETCLHQIVARLGISADHIVKAVNPKHVQGTVCRYYKSNQPMRMAYGMSHTYDEVLATDIVPLRRAISTHFGNSMYYKRCNGKMPITPDEQEYISEEFRKHGYPDGASFDRYEDKLKW